MTATQTKAAAIAAAAIFAGGGPAWAQGIVHVVPSSPIFYSAGFENGRDLDLNADGVADFRLVSEAMQVTIAPLANNRIVAIPQPPPDLGSFVAALDQGHSIGSSLDPVYQWYDRQTDPFASAAIGAQAIIGDTIVTLGYFSQRTAFSGISLEIGGATHYGWMRLANPLPIVAGELMDWAYDTRPNTPIVAGVVPEPSACVLFGFGLMTLAMLSKRKRAPAN